MSQERNAWVVVIAMLAGLAGGAASNRLLRARQALAQDGMKIRPAQVSAAHEFRLVDDAGVVKGVFRLRPDGSPELLLYDRDGKAVVWSAPRPTVRPLPAR
ncbi:MAG TPA: hypothetical protein VEU62_17595 [Bryobacterales bacterium]|nr:hypothetical protein [Bryobacterales bacterium]